MLGHEGRSRATNLKIEAQSRLVKLFGGTAIVFAMAFCAQSAAAQQAATAPGQDQVSNQPQSTGQPAPTSTSEIIVTATKRNERLRDVPEAITAVSGAALAAVGPVNNTADLISAVPGARFNNLGNPLLSEISIRGSGTERATGADSSVGLYTNGVYAGFSGNGGRNFAPIDSFDVEHIEVLEGPQGALYGRDAEYGVINIISRQPAFSNSAFVDDVFDFDTQQNIATAIGNYAINDNWAIRLGAQDTEQRSGFEYNPTRDNYYDHTSGYIVRGQVRYDAGPLDINLLAQRQEMHLPSFYSADIVAPANTATGFPGLPTYPRGFVQDPRSIPHNGVDFTRENINNVVLSVNYDFGWSKLTSTSSWRTIDTVNQTDSDYIDLAAEMAVQAMGEKGAYPFTQTNTFGGTTTYYQDLHLAGAPMFGNRLSLLGGLELLSQPQTLVQTVTQNPCASALAPNPVIGQGVCVGTPTAPACVSILPGSKCGPVVSPYGSNNVTSSRYDSYAPYASLTYKLGWGFTLGGDVRYSNDHKTAVNTVTQLYTSLPYPFLTSNGGTIPVKNYKLNDGNTTYTVTLSYKIPGSSDDLLYAKVGTGYRVGGFNYGFSPPLLTPPYPKGVTAAANYAPVVPEYGSETSTSYEAGFKGTILPHSYFTLAVYWQDTLNALAGVQDGCAATNACLAANTNYTVNAGTVHGYGVEAQFNTSWNVMGGPLSFQVETSNQSAKYVSNPTTGINGEKLNGLPLVGTQIAENPRWLVDSTLHYVHALGNDLQGFANIRYHGQWGGIQDPQTSIVGAFRLDHYEDVDLRTGVDYKALEIALIVRNLTDEVHRNAQFQQNGINTITGALVAVPTQIRESLPRSISLEASYKW